MTFSDEVSFIDTNDPFFKRIFLNINQYIDNRR